jgi:hypothetical protein
MISDPRDIAAHAANLVTGEKQDSYGHPFDDFNRAAKIWEAILGVEVTAEQVALCMVGVKISRQANAAKLDNIVDGIGYFLTKGQKSLKEFKTDFDNNAEVQEQAEPTEELYNKDLRPIEAKKSPKKEKVIEVVPEII